MAKSVKRKIKNTKSESPFKNYWQKENYLLLLAGILVLFIGNYLMTFGPWDNPISLSVAPIVLLLAYIVIFPLAIFYRKKKKSEENVSSEG
ncbi:MAG: hypothetical protein D6830_00070 [Ignavibacteria bacterium]|nr:MAG: hypothetical protein D6830_00070 [Ignavibacteria bacterium]